MKKQYYLLLLLALPILGLGCTQEEELYTDSKIEALENRIHNLEYVLDIQECGSGGLAHVYSNRLKEIDGSYGVNVDSPAYAYANYWCSK